MYKYFDNEKFKTNRNHKNQFLSFRINLNDYSNFLIKSNKKLETTNAFRSNGKLEVIKGAKEKVVRVGEAPDSPGKINVYKSPNF